MIRPIWPDLSRHITKTQHHKRERSNLDIKNLCTKTNQNQKYKDCISKKLNPSILKTAAVNINQSSKTQQQSCTMLNHSIN